MTKIALTKCASRRAAALKDFGIAEVELVYKAGRNLGDAPCIRSAADAYEVLMTAWDDTKLGLVEQFQILLLKGQRLVGLYPVSSGGLTSTVVDPRLCFVAAPKANATSIIMAHNHPSGNLSPSAADKEITAKMKASGELLEIKVLDHLIVTRQGYYSFEEGDFTMVPRKTAATTVAKIIPLPGE